VNVRPALNQPFDSVRVDPNNPKSIYAGSETGLWHSTDDGVTWVHDDPQVGLPNAPYLRHQNQSFDGRTVVFTYRSGAFALGPGLSGSALNGATYFPNWLVPGSWATVEGTNLAAVSRAWADEDFVGGGSLPVRLSGVQVTVSGVPAAVHYISPTQVNFQVPDVGTGAATVQVIRDGVPSNRFNPRLFPVRLAYSPSLSMERTTRLAYSWT
jgi:hypothetical protein